MAETWMAGEFTCVKCKEKREAEGEVKVNDKAPDGEGRPPRLWQRTSTASPARPDAPRRSAPRVPRRRRPGEHRDGAVVSQPFTYAAFSLTSLSRTVKRSTPRMRLVLPSPRSRATGPPPPVPGDEQLLGVEPAAGAPSNSASTSGAPPAATWRTPYGGAVSSKTQSRSSGQRRARRGRRRRRVEPLDHLARAGRGGQVSAHSCSLTSRPRRPVVADHPGVVAGGQGRSPARARRRTPWPSAERIRSTPLTWFGSAAPRRALGAGDRPHVLRPPPPGSRVSRPISASPMVSRSARPSGNGRVSSGWAKSLRSSSAPVWVHVRPWCLLGPSAPMADPGADRRNRACRKMADHGRLPAQ